MMITLFGRMCIISFAILFLTNCISAQEYTVNLKNISIEDGLLHRNVQTLFEDSNGLIWLGLAKGLQQYDGQEFKTWTKASRTGSIYHISAIGEDNGGWLWLYNNDLKKLVFLHSETKEILTADEKFKLDGNEQEVNIGDLTDVDFHFRMPKNAKGQLCFGSRKKGKKLYLYDTHNGFQSIQVDIDTSYSIFHIDKENNYWLDVQNHSIVKVSPEGKTLRIYKGEKDEYFSPFQVDENGNVYIYHNEFYKDNSINKFSRIDTLGNLNNGFLSEFEKSNLCFGKDFIFVNSDKLKLEIRNSIDYEVIETFNRDDHTSSLFEYSHPPFKDSRGIYWIYSKMGLNRLQIEKSKFRKYFSFPNEGAKPFNNAARGFVVNANSIYVNFELSKTVKIDKSEPNNWTELLNEQWTRSMLRKSDNEYLIGGPFHVLSIDSIGKIVDEYHTIEEESIYGIWSMYEDSKGKLWVGTGSELVYKNSDESIIRKYADSESLKGIKNNSGAIQNMIPRADGKIWFCSWVGLFLFDPAAEKVVARYGSGATGEYYLPADKFYFIYQDDDGLYWVGTGDGLIQWKGPKDEQNESLLDNGDEEYKSFTRNDGLSNDVIYAIYEDDYNRLWMSSDYGIMSFDKETYDVQAYLVKDGISHQEFNRISQFKEKDGTIYFGGLNGITAFHPKDFVKEEKSFANLLITESKIFDGSEQKLVDNLTEIQNSREINFQPNDRFFRIKFALPTFQDKSQILYAWKIEGVDENWNYQKDNSLQVGVLPYGSHTLKIKGQSGGGGWSPHEIGIKVNVIKPFYLRWWFLVLSLLALMAGIAMFLKARTNLLKREITKATIQIESDKETIQVQAEELQKLDKLKSRFFANVSHELRTPLTLMLGPINNLIKSSHRDEKDKKLLSFLHNSTLHLKNLVNEILDLSKLENNKMELNEEPVEFYSYINDRMNQFYSIGTSEAVKFDTEYSSDCDLHILLDTNKFEKILNNYISNAIKFTSKENKVKLSVKQESNDLIICVSDNGRGIHPNDLPHVFDRFYQSKQQNVPTEGGTGIGLSLCKELAKLMNGKVWVESTLGVGSHFYFSFPKKVTPIDIDVIYDSNDQKNIIADNKDQQQNLLNLSKLQGTEGSTILVVEDNSQLREYYKIILSDYKISLTENGSDAIEYLKKNESPDLILSDLMMPVMDGIQLLNILKSSDRWSQLPVIMLTAKTDRLVKLKALRYGIDDYMTKPFDEEELKVRISNLLMHSRERSNNSNLEESDSSKGPVMTEEDKKWIEVCESFILKNLTSEFLSVSWIAQEFNMSESTLTRQLKRIIGLSPGKYVNELRLNQAKELLSSDTSINVTEVSIKVGFQDAKAFSRSFKRRFGKSPSKFEA